MMGKSGDFMGKGKVSKALIRPESHGKTALGKTQLLGNPFIPFLEEDGIVLIIMLVGGVALAR